MTGDQVRVHWACSCVWPWCRWIWASIPFPFDEGFLLLLRQRGGWYVDDFSRLKWRYCQIYDISSALLDQNNNNPNWLWATQVEKCFSNHSQVNRFDSFVTEGSKWEAWHSPFHNKCKGPQTKMPCDVGSARGLTSKNISQSFFSCTISFIFYAWLSTL